MDPTATVDPTGDVEIVNPTIIPPLSLYAMMETFLTTQATHGKLIDGASH